MTETARELSVRTRPAGGAVANSVQEGPPQFLQGRHRVVVLVHGYDLAQPAARHAYRTFEGALAELYQQGGAAVIDHCARFLWPGDANLGPVSFVSYPFEMRDAMESAARLATLLQRLQGPRGGPMHVDFVAHSLGCRMLLETIRALRPMLAGLNIRLGVVCLMAAAVQVDMLEEGARLAGTLETPAVVQRLLVLYSTGDNVLHYAFPLGQTLAGEGLLPTALGRFGPPPGIGGEREAVNALGHGDYWSSRLAAYHVAQRLALGAIRQDVQAMAVAEHRPPGAQSIASHGLPAHRLLGDQAP